MIGRKKKPTSVDYSRQMLPQTRKAVFFDVLHLQFRPLFLLGLIAVMLYCPLLLSSLAKALYASGVHQAIRDGGPEAVPALGQSLVLLDILHAFFSVVLIPVFTLSLSGISRIVRQYAWGENVHLTTDFAKGVRDNYGAITLLGVLTGLIFALCVSVFYHSLTWGHPIVSILCLLPIGISILLVLPVFSVALAMIPIYRNPFPATLKNAFYVYIHAPWKVLGVLACCLLVWLPSLIPHFYGQLLGGIFGALATPFVLLAWDLFCYDLFDRFINPQVSPELIGKGIVWE